MTHDKGCHLARIMEKLVHWSRTNCIYFLPSFIGDKRQNGNVQFEIFYSIFSPLFQIAILCIWPPCKYCTAGWLMILGSLFCSFFHDEMKLLSCFSAEIKMSLHYSWCQNNLRIFIRILLFSSQQIYLIWQPFLTHRWQVSGVIISNIIMMKYTVLVLNCQFLKVSFMNICWFEDFRKMLV